MALQQKERLADDAGLRDLLDEMANRIVAGTSRLSSLAFIGILKGGAPIAEYLARRVGEAKGLSLPVAYLDITLYRDDMIQISKDPQGRLAEIPFALKNRDIVLVDDVLNTGRTVRAALSSVLTHGRPRVIRLAVVVDRGDRELPIHADIVGMTYKSPPGQSIRVRAGTGQDCGIFLFENAP